MTTIVETATSLLSLIVGMGSLIFCRKRIFGHRTHRKGCLSVKFLVCSVCQTLGVYSQQLPITVPQYDISSEGESLPDEIPEEAAPNDNSNDEEWWSDEVELNTVTISNMSIGTVKSSSTPVRENLL